jgi:hypothetical protein
VAAIYSNLGIVILLFPKFNAEERTAKVRAVDGVEITVKDIVGTVAEGSFVEFLGVPTDVTTLRAPVHETFDPGPGELFFLRIRSFLITSLQILSLLNGLYRPSSGQKHGVYFFLLPAGHSHCV